MPADKRDDPTIDVVRVSVNDTLFRIVGIFIDVKVFDAEHAVIFYPLPMAHKVICRFIARKDSEHDERSVTVVLAASLDDLRVEIGEKKARGSRGPAWLEDELDLAG